MSDAALRETLGSRLKAKSRVEPNGCHVWTGGISDTGYGTLRSVNKKGDVMGAHRASYLFHHGPIPAGMYVCHRCDNPPCINPEHLFLGTPAANVADCVNKNRVWRGSPGAKKGEENPCAKLTAEEVREIRAANQTQEELARKYNVARSSIGFIRSRKTWRHVT